MCTMCCGHAMLPKCSASPPTDGAQRSAIASTSSRTRRLQAFDGYGEDRTRCASASNSRSRCRSSSTASAGRSPFFSPSLGSIAGFWASLVPPGRPRRSQSSQLRKRLALACADALRCCSRATSLVS
jgi:hypothetical protein